MLSRETTEVGHADRAPARRRRGTGPLAGAVAALVVLVAAPTAGANVSDVLERLRSPLAPAARAEPVPRSVDEAFAAVAARVPAFGGAYIDWPARTLQIRMTDAGPSASVAKQVLIDVTGNPILDRLRPVARKAEYDFLQLKAWYDRIAPRLLAMRGTVFTDIDERRNRLVVGMERPARRGAAVTGRLRALGIPRGALVSERARRGTDEACENLRSECRPLVGGLEIRSERTSGPCTLGFNALRAGVHGPQPDTGFVTNSHCTPTRGKLDGGAVFGQPTLFEIVGYEIADPPFGTPPGCPAGKRCRFSDSAFVKSFHAPEVDRGGIAMPPESSTTNDESCPNDQPCKYDGTNRFRIVLKGDPMVGQFVEKVGRTTGRSNGTVTRTCVAAVRDFGTYLCQSQGNYPSRGGDSGAPVFTPLFGSRFVILVGIHWSTTVHAHRPEAFREFSPISGIQRDLGTLNVCTTPLDFLC